MKTYGKLYLNKLKNHWVLADVKPHVSIKLKAIFEKIPKSYALVTVLPDNVLKWQLKYSTVIN
jgi:hypothetical protein